MGWVSPTGFLDPDTKWDEEIDAYDGNTSSDAWTYPVLPETWSSFLELTHAVIPVSKVRFWVMQDGYRGDVDVDVYYGDAWHHVYQGVANHLAWKEVDIPDGEQLVTAARFSQYNPHGSTNASISLYEFEFWGVIVTPTVTTQAVSSIATTTATGNGTITDDGGETPSAWGVCVAETENPDINDEVQVQKQPLPPL